MNIFHPTSYASAKEIAESFGDRAQYVAGATLLSIDDTAVWRSQIEEPACALIDVSRLPDSQGIRLTQTSLRIGAATPLEVVRTHALVGLHAPLLRNACKTIGSMALRYQATLGGNVGWRRGDSIAALMVHQASMELADGELCSIESICLLDCVPLIIAIHVPVALDPRHSTHEDQPEFSSSEIIEIFEKVAERQAFSSTRVVLALRAAIAVAPAAGRYISSLKIAAGGASFNTRVLNELVAALQKVSLRSPGLPALVEQASLRDLPDHPNLARIVSNLITGHLQC
jgi:CO/xanthine dehydrogenase FAD-binding subunit